MNSGETPWLTAKLLPVLDLAHGDFHSLGLGELQTIGIWTTPRDTLAMSFFFIGSSDAPKLTV